MTSRTKKAAIRAQVRKEAATAAKLSDAVADHAELGFREHRSSRALADYLDARGFKVEFPWKHLPTAFHATSGRGKPTIGILAEYDALPNCGLAEGTPGHGCAHNLFGVGSAVGAVAAARILEHRGMPGRIVLWGCPAEEPIAGKPFMARDGAFRNQDVVLSWHPGGDNQVRRQGGSAVDSVLFEFFGRTAHGAYPVSGRSALDAVMIMDVAVNYLREHLPDNVRVHMCIPDGGDAPNVVPAYASAHYYVRGKNRAEVDGLRKRVIACAKAGAMATETRLKVTLLAGAYDRLPNEALSDITQANFDLFGPPRPTEADRRNVKKLGKKPEFNEKIGPPRTVPGFASSDEANVSWMAPMSVFSTACHSKGISAHHRDLTAQMKLPFAHKGMLRGAEILAATALDLCSDSRLLARVRAEFRKRTKGFKYDPLIPARPKRPHRLLTGNSG